MSFFSNAFRGLASVFTPSPAPRDPAAPVPRPDPAVGFWAGLFRTAVDVALTKKGGGRRTEKIRKALTGGAGALMLAAVLAGGAGQRAEAQGALCADRADVVQRLQEKYGESRRGIGLLQDQRVVEIWTSPNSGTWTIVITLPDGSTCLLAAGEDWEVMDEPAPVADRDA
ncbi:hypothetical protein ACQ5SO_12785 [Rhodovulum sp. DZ06]|uniref:hypothetical protein n=1 Tax=Rhodovulum sp. DZ06 TaxID=3425126 RepID=UPI003D3455A9